MEQQALSLLRSEVPQLQQPSKDNGRKGSLCASPIGVVVIKERTVWKSPRRSSVHRDNRLITGKTCLVMAVMGQANCKAGSIHIQLQPLEIQESNNKSLNQNYPTSNISKQLKMQTLSTFTSSSISKVSTAIIRMQHQLMLRMRLLGYNRKRIESSKTSKIDSNSCKI